MEEQFNNKLILNRKTSLRKKNTLYSSNEKINSIPISINNTNNNKPYLAFKSLSKIYHHSGIKNSQIESLNDKKRISKTPNNFFFKRSDKKQNLKRVKTLQTLKKCDSKLTNE